MDQHPVIGNPRGRSSGSQSQRQQPASSSGGAKKSVSFAPEQPSKPAVVEIVVRDHSEPMVSGVPRSALLRFSREAVRTLPRKPPSNRDADPAPERLLIVPVGEITPTHAAFAFVAEWMAVNEQSSEPNTFYPAGATDRDMSYRLLQSINILAAALALDCNAPSVIGRHAAMIAESMHKRPISKEKLEATWTLLPKNHQLVDAAISSLTRFWLTDKIATSQIKELGDYLVEDEELERRFARQRQFQGNRRALGTEP